MNVHHYILIHPLIIGISLLLLTHPDWVTLAPWAPVPPGVLVALSKGLALGGGLLVGTGLLGTYVVERNWAKRLDVWLAYNIRSFGILAILIGAYIVSYVAFTWQRHYFFNSAGFDLGLQDQVVWNTSQGRWFETSLEEGNYLGDHFQPLLALLAIPYRIYPSVIWLMIFQSVSLGLGAVPLFILARRRLDSPLSGLILATAFLLYPSTGYINRFDFHFEVVVVPLLLAAWEAIDRNRLATASIFLGIALLGKEEVGLTVAMLGVVSALQFRIMRFGISWMIGGVVYSLVTLFLVIPMFRSVEIVRDAVPFVSNNSADALARYFWLGQTPMEMLKTILLRPLYVLQGIHERGWFHMLLILVAPLAFTPIFSPVHLLALLPSLAVNLLSDFWAQHTAYYQYVVLFIPVFFIGAIYGTKWLIADNRRFIRTTLCFQTDELRRIFILISILAYSFVSFYHSNPFADQGIVNDAWIRRHNEAQIRSALSLIPSDASIATTNHYIPHLSHRPNAFLYFEFRSDYSSVVSADYLLLNLDDERDATPEEYLRLLKIAAEEGFGVIFDKGNVIVVQRQAGDTEQLHRMLLQSTLHE